jgi:hypothetical protein
MLSAFFRTPSNTEHDVYPESSTTPRVEDAVTSDLDRFWSLDTMIQWLTVIKDGSDIHPIPFLKGCVAVTLDIVQNVKVRYTAIPTFVPLLTDTVGKSVSCRLSVADA